MTCCQTIARIITDEYGIKVDDVILLIPNLDNKTKYIVHYKNL